MMDWPTSLAVRTMCRTYMYMCMGEGEGGKTIYRVLVCTCTCTCTMYNYNLHVHAYIVHESVHPWFSKLLHPETINNIHLYK